MHPWGPKDIGILIGSILVVMLNSWGAVKQHTNTVVKHLDGIDEKLSALANRVATVERSQQEILTDNSSIRDRASRTESRVDMLYILIGAPGRDPHPRVEEDRRRGSSKINYGRRRTDPQPPRGEEDEDG